MSRDLAIHDLVESIYTSALEPSNWAATLGQLDEIFGLVGSTLLFADSQAAHPPVMAFHGLDPVVVQQYNESFVGKDPTVQEAMRLPVGTFFSSAGFFSDAVWERSELYSDLLSENDLYYIEGSALLMGNGVHSMLGLHSNHRRGPLDGEKQRLYGLLVPHLQRAFGIHQKIQGTEDRSKDLEETVDQLRAGVILLTRRGRVVSVNAEARRITGEGDGLTIHDKHLIAALPAHTALLEAAVGAALLGGLESSGSSLCLPRPSGRRGLEILITPLPRSQGTAAVAVFVTDPERTTRPPARWLMDLYRLSQAESEICLLLLQGLGLSELADSRSVSVKTVRSQLKTIFQKVGVRRQSDLIRTLIAGPLGFVRSQHDSEGGIAATKQRHD